jgi:hypothetical protein
MERSPDRTCVARRSARLWLLVAAVLLGAFPLGAQRSGATEERAERFVFSAFPDSDLYPDYIADPLRPQSALMIASVLDSEIPDSGNGRYVLRLGGNFSLFRVHPAGEPNRGLQLDFKGGFFGHFDVDHSLDNIGWDGLYGLLLTWRPTGSLGLRVGTLHDSAHVGDEYAERTGRERIGYTRQEWVAGFCWMPSPRWRAYGEGGWGFGLDEFQEPLRLQVGVEASGRRRFWNDRGSWYAAADVGAYEEWDWDTRLTIQAGIAIRTGRGSQRYRLAIEYAKGRSALGEFTQHEESTLGIGWFFDF